VDAVTMTGNVAQVFLSDEEWLVALQACQRALRAGGHLIFEARDPAANAWLGGGPVSHTVLYEMDRKEGLGSRLVKPSR